MIGDFVNYPNGIKKKNSNRFVNMFILPGNHDLSLTEESRKREDIQEHYDNEDIECLLEEEFSLLNNFYTYSNANGQNNSDRIITRKFCSFGDYKVQFNLINTALFSSEGSVLLSKAIRNCIISRTTNSIY